MHGSTSSRGFVARTAFVVLMVSLLGVVGCPKQEDFPAALDLVVPPTPTNFVITRVDPQDFDYDFTWEVNDPTDVDRYRVYLLGTGLIPDELLFETTNPFYYGTFTFSLTGLQFAVAAVSTQGVEGERAVEEAP